MTIARIGVALEIIGVILGASSLVGHNRLAHWEAAIRTYLNARQFISGLAQKRQPILSTSFRILYKPVSIIVSICTAIAQIFFQLLALGFSFAMGYVAYHLYYVENYV